jgi:hypothetical protein
MVVFDCVDSSGEFDSTLDIRLRLLARCGQKAARMKPSQVTGDFCYTFVVRA